MRQTLEKLSEFLETTQNLGENERGFISDYMMEFSQNLRYPHHDQTDLEPNLLALYNEYGADDYAGFIIFLLEKCYEEDDYQLVSFISSCCYGNLPQNTRVRDILLRGIKNSDKSNRLRERFFWNLYRGFKAEARRFYLQDLQEFITDNFANPTLVGEVINYMYSNFEKDDQELQNIRVVVNQYIGSKPEVVKHLLSSIKELLGIA